jgi:pimeloyl-ACP methyl ester carboxylesterase
MIPVQVLLALVFVAARIEAQVSDTQRNGTQAPLPPAPGRLIDIGGRRLHLLCSGEGSPTVILEAGASSFAIDWTLVQRDAARTNRTCSYDRAGMGWSDPATPTTRASSASDLHTLLEKAGEHGPYVLVGASRGGLLVRSYLDAYPDDVAGFVFVDPSTEDRLFTMIDGQAMAIAEVTAEQLRTTFPRQTIAVPRRRPQTGAPFDRLPTELYRIRVQLDEQLIASTPDSVSAEIVGASQESERAFLAKLLATRKAPYPLGSRPTVVLTRGDEKSEGRESSHAALAKLSSNSRHSIVAGAGHEIHLFEPSAVITGIADVVRAIREKTTLPQRIPDE